MFQLILIFVGAILYFRREGVVQFSILFVGWVHRIWMFSNTILIGYLRSFWYLNQFVFFIQSDHQRDLIFHRGLLLLFQFVFYLISQWAWNPYRYGIIPNLFDIVSLRWIIVELYGYSFLIYRVDMDFSYWNQMVLGYVYRIYFFLLSSIDIY